jgi:hypothetical protein
MFSSVDADAIVCHRSRRCGQLEALLRAAEHDRGSVAGAPPGAAPPRAVAGVLHRRLDVIEGLLAIGAGLLAGSVALVGFGVDSSIEVISVLGLLWRLRNAGPDATVAEESGATMWPTLAGGRRSAWSSTGSSRRSSSC